MIETQEYYGGTYPEPDYEEELEKEKDYEDYIADIMHEEMMIGE